MLEHDTEDVKVEILWIFANLCYHKKEFIRNLQFFREERVMRFYVKGLEESTSEKIICAVLQTISNIFEHGELHKEENTNLFVTEFLEM